MCRCSRRFIHIEVPNYRNTSAFYPVLCRESEHHLDYDLFSLFRDVSASLLVHDGRCVFPKKELIDENASLSSFLSTVDGYATKESYRECDVSALCELERKLTRVQRLTYGYQVFAIGDLAKQSRMGT
jgi:hypothetical protein